MVLIYPLMVHHLEGQGKSPDCLWSRMLNVVPFISSEPLFLVLSLWKLIFGQGFVETEESAKLADIYFHLLLPSQSEVQREEIEKHQLMLERGNNHLPLHLPHRQNPGRRVGRKGKNCNMIQKALKQTKELCRFLHLHWMFVLLWLGWKSLLW